MEVRHWNVYENAIDYVNVACRLSWWPIDFRRISSGIVAVEHRGCDVSSLIDPHLLMLPNYLILQIQSTLKKPVFQVNN